MLKKTVCDKFFIYIKVTIWWVWLIHWSIRWCVHCFVQYSIKVDVLNCAIAVALWLLITFKLKGCIKRWVKYVWINLTHLCLLAITTITMTRAIITAPDTDPTTAAVVFTLDDSFVTTRRFPASSGIRLNNELIVVPNVDGAVTSVVDILLLFSGDRVVPSMYGAVSSVVDISLLFSRVDISKTGITLI